MWFLVLFCVVFGYELDEFHAQLRYNWLAKIGRLDHLMSFQDRQEISSIDFVSWKESISGVIFSGIFTDNTVLQREPQLASVYGALDSPDGIVIVTLKNVDTNEEFVFYPEIIPAPNEYYTHNWKALFPQPFKNGGNYTLSVECEGCLSNNTETLYNITFGDVYYCSGQSNMELAMEWTFSRNLTYEGIKAGKYMNIRYQTYNNLYLPNISYVTPPGGKWVPYPDNNTLNAFSAPCWYFAQSLYDNFTVTDVTIGLIDTSIGGTMIEQWSMNNTQQLSCHDTLCPNPNCGNLYNGLVAGFLNTTIKAILWYQGENNMYEVHGSWLNATGYGCMEPVLINQWRSQWSVVPGTTDPLVPFGLVTLPTGTGEGSPDMAGMRWAQASNLGYMDNYVVPNTFVAHGFDLQDPWNKECFYLNPPTCQGYDVPYNWNATNYYMGPIHPRDKIQVGQRLAQAGYNMLYGNGDNKYMTSGPYLKGCQMNQTEGTIVIAYNETMLKGQTVHYVPPDFWYNESLINTIYNWSAIQINIGKDWYFANVTTDGRAATNQVIVDITPWPKDAIIGIRYAYWEIHCCGTLDMNYNPCPPASCPIKTTDPNSGIVLPASPFWARINQTNGECYCWEPQVCGGI